TYADNASPPAFSEPVVGAADGNIIWHLASLAVNGDATYTYSVTVVGTCPTSVQCSADVHVDAYCADGHATASANCTFNIPCPGNSCPRTVGFWSAQCNQKPNGSTKFTKDEVNTIAKCIDSNSKTFDFSSASSAFDGFCAFINPDRPMDCKKQAHRQFAGLLANLCTGNLQLIANNGDKMSLHPNAPNPHKGSIPEANTFAQPNTAQENALADLHTK